MVNCVNTVTEDDQSIWSKRRKLSSHQVDSREPNNLSSCVNTLLHVVGAAHTTETVAGALLPLLLLAVSAGVTVLIFVWYKKCRKRSRKRITKSKNVRVTDSVLR